MNVKDTQVVASNFDLTEEKKVKTYQMYEFKRCLS